MKLTNIMYDLEEGTASLGLFGEIDEDGHIRPPHVQISVHAPGDGTRAELRRAAIERALAVLDRARAGLEAEL